MYDIQTIDYKDGSIHYNPNDKVWPYRASVYGINSQPMPSELKAKHWITKLINNGIKHHDIKSNTN